VRDDTDHGDIWHNETSRAFARRRRTLFQPCRLPSKGGVMVAGAIVDDKLGAFACFFVTLSLVHC